MLCAKLQMFQDVDASDTVVEFLRRYVVVLKTMEAGKRHDYASRLISICVERYDFIDFLWVLINLQIFYLLYEYILIVIFFICCMNTYCYWLLLLLDVYIVIV